MIQAKAEGVELAELEAAAEPKDKVVDLMAALRDSVRAARELRGEEAGEAEGREMPARKAAGKKTAARKTTTKAPVKKTTRKGPAS